MADLEHISQHVFNKISSLQRMLELSDSEIPQQKIKKLGQELIIIEKLLEEFETCVDQQKEQLNFLKELDQSFQVDLEHVQHMKDNMPTHIPRKARPVGVNGFEQNQDTAAAVQPTRAEPVPKTSRTCMKEMKFITMAEFDSIPQYMKGRVSYDQLNAAVESLNTAITAKYKIVSQSVKSLSNHARKLRQRFKEQETKDTKGRYFVVEDDIREFTQLKVDKRFQGILNMLRHCQRLRELRGAGLVRYVVL